MGLRGFYESNHRIFNQAFSQGISPEQESAEGRGTETKRGRYLKPHAEVAE
jgi:hypothetical protein